MRWLKEYWKHWLEWEAIEGPAEAEAGDQPGSAELARLSTRERADLPMELPQVQPDDCRA